MELRACKWRGGETPKNISISPTPSRFLSCLCLVCLFSLHFLVSGSNDTVIGGSSACSTRTGTHRLQEGGVAAKRRQLLMRGGPGSYPPRCASKCGSCTPCRAVHVPVSPGRAVIAEYYPEAWRCKCHNHLYLP